MDENLETKEQKELTPVSEDELGELLENTYNQEQAEVFKDRPDLEEINERRIGERERLSFVPSFELLNDKSAVYEKPGGEVEDTPPGVELENRLKGAEERANEWTNLSEEDQLERYYKIKQLEESNPDRLEQREDEETARENIAEMLEKNTHTMEELKKSIESESHSEVEGLRERKIISAEFGNFEMPSETWDKLSDKEKAIYEQRLAELKSIEPPMRFGEYEGTYDVRNLDLRGATELLDQTTAYEEDWNKLSEDEKTIRIKRLQEYRDLPQGLGSQSQEGYDSGNEAAFVVESLGTSLRNQGTQLERVLELRQEEVLEQETEAIDKSRDELEQIYEAQETRRKETGTSVAPEMPEQKEEKRGGIGRFFRRNK